MDDQTDRPVMHWIYSDTIKAGDRAFVHWGQWKVTVKILKVYPDGGFKAVRWIKKHKCWSSPKRYYKVTVTPKPNNIIRNPKPVTYWDEYKRD